MKNLVLRTLALLMLMLVVACGGGITADNVAKIKNGMTLEEVKDILGEPTDGGSNSLQVGDMKLGAGAYKWEDGDKLVTITFANGKVTMVAKSGF